MRGRRAAAVVGLAAAATAIVLAAGGQGAARGRAAPPEVRAAARAGLATLLGPELARGLDRLGFRSRAEAAGATIADGFQIFTVPPDLLLANESADVAVVAAPSTQWLFLVVSGNAPRALLTVDRVNGAWTAVSIGGADLSEDLAA